MKIVVLDGFTLNPGDLNWTQLNDFGQVTIYDRTPIELVAERISDANAVFTNKTVLNENLMDSAKSLRFIGVLATGYNVVDIDAANKRGIVVSNVPTYGTNAVAQFTFALLLEICHHVAHHNLMVQSGEWQRRGDFCFWDYPLIELADKTMGIIGYGKIGQSVGKLAKAFHMNVIAYDPVTVTKESVTLDELLSLSDIVSLHCPFLPDTHHIINQESLQKMKNGVIILNTSRGQLIDEKALRKSLVNGKVYYAAVDVVSEEPISSSNPLLGLDNCIITPHIAWAPKESRQRLLNIAVENLRAFVHGKPINVVK